MTKLELAIKVSKKLGLEKTDVISTIESVMDEIKGSLSEGENVYLRGFGSFVVKRRAEKTARNISKNTILKVPAHNTPTFKPSKVFVDVVKSHVKVKK